MNNPKLITLVNENFETIEVELLCAFEIEEFDHNKYIIYTKNEHDEQGNNIIYSGKLEIKEDKQYLININDGNEWDKIKQIMKEMAKFKGQGN